MTSTMDLYNQWLKEPTLDRDLRKELLSMGQEEETIADCFYQELTFGTSGIRGKMGPGTANLNVHVIGRATRGLAAYILKNYENPSAAIAYDSRIGSRDFADETARILCEAGIAVYMFEDISPVASLSFAIRQLGLSMGVMITASHNPKEYNGYKVYDHTGCQIVGEAPREIARHMAAFSYFAEAISPPRSDLQEAAGESAGTTEGHLPEHAKASRTDREITEDSKESATAEQKRLLLEGHPLFHYIEKEILGEYVRQAVVASLPGGGEEELKIVYTPLNGSGRRFVPAALYAGGFNNLTFVQNQMAADGRFLTCPVPNPECPAVFTEAERVCDEVQADLILATDPDCDRVGVAIRRENNYWYPTGNQVGILLCHYLCENRQEVEGKTIVRSIVSSPLIDHIAKAHGVQLATTLTGFKYIGEKMNALGEDFLFGFEEGNGYLAATHVRDKDGVSAALLIAQMAAFYKRRSMDLYDALHVIYATYGYMREEVRGFTFEGRRGKNHMAEIMDMLRQDSEEYYPAEEFSVRDYKDGLNGLPPADVLEFVKNEDEKTVIRPSGTEPKIKAYAFARGEDKESVRVLLDEAEAIVQDIMGVD